MRHYLPYIDNTLNKIKAHQNQRVKHKSHKITKSWKRE